MDFLMRTADFLWNPWLLSLFLMTGLVYSIGSGFFQLFSWRLWWRSTAGSLLKKGRRGDGGLSPLQALATALASTMGTGSIAGVAAALTLGGPGAVFWMWVSALLGMMTSCGEKLLAVKYQRPSGPDGKLRGGPMYYIRDGLGFPLLASLFCLACIPATLAGGNLIQSSSIASSLESAFGLPRLPVGLITALLAGLVMVGGLGRIAAVSSALVPAMALLYLGSGGLVLLYNWEKIPSALALIVSCALSPSAAAGGAGWTVSAALRYGVARGVFTNEAGLGTSAIAHGAAQTDHPARQGMWGIFEVFLSTVLVCTVTALAILVSGVWTPAVPGALTGAPLTAAAFRSVLGPFGQAAVALSLLLFAFSSILGWSYYGEQCLFFLSGSKRRQPENFVAIYRLAFLSSTVLGAVWSPQIIWQLVDLCNALMALPNLLALLFLAPQALSLLSLWKNKYTSPKS